MARSDSSAGTYSYSTNAAGSRYWLPPFAVVFPSLVPSSLIRLQIVEQRVTCPVALLFAAAVLHAADLVVTTGGQITRDKTADEGKYLQDSRPGPSVGIEYLYSLNRHSGLGFEVDYANTNTQLSNFAQNTWTMNRISIDGDYIYHWRFGSATGADSRRQTRKELVRSRGGGALKTATVLRDILGKAAPFIKVGAGGLITLSGRAPGGVPVGLDGRLEEIAALGLSYRISRRFSLLTGYEVHFFRNPDFSDHTWRPERNEVSEPKLGLVYTFGTRVSRR